MNKKQQRLVLIVAILTSLIAYLDGSVINVALPAITHEFGGGLSVQQWVVDAYLISFGALMLIAGSFSDLFGRKKILFVGLISFGITSLLCAIAPNGTFLIMSRILQGAAGALLVPTSLALIISSFKGAAQAKAIGSWTAWTGIAFLVGPLLGGVLVDAGSWRYVFFINLVPIALTIWLLSKLQSPKRTQGRHVPIDGIGALLCVIALGGPVYALIEQPHYGWSSPLIFVPLIVGLITSVVFVWFEHQTPYPMFSFHLFKDRNFTVGNIATAAIYAGLSLATFLISVFAQQTGGYSATQAGLALIPITLMMFLLSSRFGALAGKYGPRIFMSIGPIISAVGFITMLWVDNSVTYLSLLPGVILFGIGLAITVAPLTEAVLGSIDSAHAGIGSAINSAVSRIAGLVAIAAIGVVAAPSLDLAGFHKSAIITAALLALGGIISFVGIKNHTTKANVLVEQPPTAS